MKVRVLFYLGFLLLTSSFFLRNSQLPNNPPKYFMIGEYWKSVVQSKEVFLFKNPDKLIDHQMKLLMDETGLPLFYYADIQTPVCIDGLCKPVRIEMYWDLVGNYAGFGTYPEEPLTKYDHDLFEEADHLTLHKLLLDQNSVLGRRKLSQLYEKERVREETIKFKGVEIDGISGATKKEIKESIVDGGLYSCYTLWHLAYGMSTEKIRSHLPTIYSDSLSDYFINSGYEAYQVYAFKKLNRIGFQEKIASIVPVIKKGKPLTRSYLLKKMPKDLYQHPLVVYELYKDYAEFDLNSRTLLIENLAYSTPTAVAFLAEQLAGLSENQLKKFLSVINKMELVEAVKKQLSAFAEDTTAPYRYLVKDFLAQKK